MNLKFILDDPDSAIIEVWQSPENCSHLSEIRDLAAEIGALKQDIKSVKESKQEISSQFKLHKDNTEKLSELKTDMQKVSSRLSELETLRKEKEQHILDYFAVKKPELKPDFPARFTTSTSAPTSASKCVIEQLANTDRDLAEWSAYCASHTQASAYHQIGWKQVVEKSFGHRCIYLIARETSTKKIVGVLPLTGFSSKIFGNFAVSVPFFNYGGPLADSQEIIQELIRHARKLQEHHQWTHIELRCTSELADLPFESRKASMILSLPEDIETLENSLGAKVRAQYKLADKETPHICFGGMELLEDYYRVFAHNMRDLGTPVYSKNFFKQILVQFPDQATLVVAYIKSKPMATAFLFGYKDLLEIPWASTLRKANQYNLNMWMYKNILDFAISKKYPYFDFGRSTIEAGTYKFKKQWGAKPLMHYWHYVMPGNEPAPQLNPDNPKFKLAIAIWKKLPVFVSKILGPPLVKNIP